MTFRTITTDTETYEVEEFHLPSSMAAFAMSGVLFAVRVLGLSVLWGLAAVPIGAPNIGFVPMYGLLMFYELLQPPLREPRKKHRLGVWHMVGMEIGSAGATWAAVAIFWVLSWATQ